MKYRHLFFDLDHTLWDFDKNAEETLHELFHSYNLKDLGLVADLLIETYTRNNHALWTDYHLGKISKQVLRETRFRKTFLELGLQEAHIPLQFEEDYVRICPTKTNLFPHTHEILRYLQSKYHLHLISNGFKASTEYKLQHTRLKDYFRNVIISEVLGINKPDKAIFQHALDLAGAEAGNSLMIGDSIEADIRGARDFGMDALYFNPHQKPLPADVHWQIHHLSELEAML